MHMKNPILFGLMAILLLGGTITPALSQSSPNSNSVVINEVEIDPQNGSEFVELYNPTTQSIDVGGWSITPSASWKNYKIVENTVIEPQSFASFTHSNYWFMDFGDTISLTNNFGELIDKTPLLIDKNNDGKTWQRSTDGLDTDSTSDWELKRMTPNSSNGKLLDPDKEILYPFMGKTDKSEYTFGETLTISGSMAEVLFSDRFQNTPETVKVNIQGPNYYDTVALYPDRDLKFSTNFAIKKILGFDAGNYNVEISYGKNNINTNFVVSEELTSTVSETDSNELEIFTDKESYLPGETVIIFGDVISSLEYAGLQYVVLDPNGKQISQGTIFPNTQFSTVHSSGGGEIYPFSTQLLMSGVNPVYGTYQIFGTFKAQDPIYRSEGIEINASDTFQLIEDIKEDVSISLSTDKDIYELGDIVKITGRSNEIWTEDLELQIIQTGVLEKDVTESRYQAFSPFNQKYSIKLNGDGTFEYDFKIPINTQNTLSYGDYLIKVSEYFGQNSKIITVVKDSDSFVDIRTPLGLSIDNPTPVLGTSITIYGQIMNYKNDNTSIRSHDVKLTFRDSSGKTLMSEDRREIDKHSDSTSKAPNTPLTFTAIPDQLGVFKIDTILHPIQFDIGKYTATANYYASKVTESIELEVVTAQSGILSTVEQEEPLSFEICSSTRNQINEILKDLKQIGKGEIPPSMESVDCDGSTDFATGEKLVIRGNVVLKQNTYLDDSSTKPSGSTQEGHSYTTNYAQSQRNFVELSIPYPQTLIVSTSYQTIPDAGEEYHGGGGSGAGGVTVGDGSQGIGSGTGGDQSSRQTDSQGSTGYDGQAILREVTKNLTDMRVKAYPDSEGNFATVFDIRAGVFASGIYKLKASYFEHRSEQSFLVNDNSLKGGLEPELILNFDKNEYVPGDIVSISGKITNVYYYDPVSVKVTTPADISKINCLSGQSCDSENNTKRIRVSEGVEGATFFMNYKLSPDSSIGQYIVSADTHFGEIEKSFFVIDKSDVISSDIVSSTSSGQPSTTSKIIEKFNRIPDNEIPITLESKDIDESLLVPRVIQGSMFTSARGEESQVSLEITTVNGQCIIGQNSNCLVSESTRKPGEIYSIVSIDDINYKVRYSGNDVRLEKFSIVPEDSNSQLIIDNWTVKIIKDEQPTRFYYKVSYIALE